MMTTDSAVYPTANATFPLPQGKHHRHRSIAVDIPEGVDARVVVSREDVESARLIVESTWAGEDLVLDDLSVSSGSWYDSLSLVPTSTESSHIVHVVVPLGARAVPALYLNSIKTIELAVHPSADDLRFKSVSAKTTEDIIFPSIQAGDVHLETVAGDVKGEFNVSRAIVFRTITGDIDVTVNVVPCHHGHKGNHTHPHKPHNLTESEHEHEHKHKKDKAHGKHKSKRDVDEDDDEEKPKSRHGWWPFGSDEVEDHDDFDVEFDDLDEFEMPPPPSHEPGPHGPPPPPPPPPHGPPPPPHHGGPPPPPPPPPPPHHGGPPPPGPPPHGPKPGKGKGKGKHPHPPHHPPHHGPPPPVFIGGFSNTGSVSLTVHAPHFVSTVIKAISHTGHVTVKDKSFKGLFEAGTFVGNATITVGDDKEVKIIKEVVGEKGGFVKGFVKPKNGTFPHPHPPKKGQKGKKEDEHEHDEGVEVDVDVDFEDM